MKDDYLLVLFLSRESALNALKSAIATSARLNNPEDYCEEWRLEIANMQRVVDEIEGKANEHA